MASSEILTLRLSPAVSRRLGKLSKATERTRSRLAAEAIERYLDDQAWQVEAIEEGVRSAEAGELRNHSEVKAWVEGWGKAKGRRRP